MVLRVPLWLFSFAALSSCNGFNLKYMLCFGHRGLFTLKCWHAATALTLFNVRTNQGTYKIPNGDASYVTDWAIYLLLQIN